MNNKFCVTVKTEDLLAVLQKVNDYHLDYVQLTCLDEDEIGDVTIPAQLHISGSVSSDFTVSIDFDDIDLVQDGE